MKGIVITTDNKMSVKDFGVPVHKTVGEAVGGYIEIVRPVRLPRPLVMLINEEGKLKELPANLMGCCFYGSDMHGDLIVGNIVIAKEGIVNGEPDIVGLDDQDIASVVDLVARATEGGMTLSE